MIAQAFQHIKEKNVLVLGDFLCDLYTKGKAHRVSPEAPVVVLHVEEQHRLAGGAGNVVFNLQALGANVFPIGLIGDDQDGKALLESFQIMKISTEGIFRSTSVTTIVKNRMIADSQQLLRVDFEKKYDLSNELEDEIISYILKVIPNFDVIAISDYQKGFLTNKILKKTIECARKFSIGVVVDPKGDNFEKYLGATYIKPNAKEAYLAAKSPSTEAIQSVARRLLEKGYCDAYIITRSELGMTYFSVAGDELHFPVKVKEVVDVTGAGDTALAMITMCLANKIDISSTIPLANIASSIAIEKLGCAHVSLASVASRLIELDLKDKFISIDHLEILKVLLRNQPYILYFLDEVDSWDLQLIDELKKSLSRFPDFKKIIFYKNGKYSSIIQQIISSFEEADYIITDANFIEKLLDLDVPNRIEVFSKHSDAVCCGREQLLSILVN